MVHCISRRGRNFPTDKLIRKVCKMPPEQNSVLLEAFGLRIKIIQTLVHQRQKTTTTMEGQKGKRGLVIEEGSEWDGEKKKEDENMTVNNSNQNS